MIQYCRDWPNEDKDCGTLFSAFGTNSELRNVAIEQLLSLNQTRWLRFAQLKNTSRKRGRKATKEDVIETMKRRRASRETALFLAQNNIVLPWTFVVMAGLDDQNQLVAKQICRT